MIFRNELLKFPQEVVVVKPLPYLLHGILAVDAHTFLVAQHAVLEALAVLLLALALLASASRDVCRVDVCLASGILARDGLTRDLASSLEHFGVLL